MMTSSEKAMNVMNTNSKKSVLNRLTKAILAVFIFNSLAPGFLLAQIIADPNQPKQPTIHESANGTPQVNIQTPTKGGVSMNHYSQFDVDKNGAILNNSRKDTQTELGGYVKGNPWLATGEADIIVNQVNSANPSYLGGYIEVAGKKADVIIANPSGLNIDGAGFINANQAVLTTGDVLMSNGHLQGFDVNQGEVNITGQGLDARGANYTQILTTAANINAGIWGNEIQIVAGHYSMDKDGKITVDENADLKDKPKYAIDTKNLGGMYAGQITLVSTDRDRHVNHEGEIFASAGGVVINADGTISNSGIINSNQEKANITINAKKVENSGTISSQHHQKISAKEIINSGLMAARGELSVKAKYLTVNQGAMNAGRIDITADELTNKGGKIVQTGSQTLEVNADNFTNINNALVGSVPLDLGTGNGEDPTIPGSERPDPTEKDPIPGGDGKPGTVETAPPLPPLTLADGAINVKNIINDNGVLTGNGDIHLVAKESLVNDGSAMHIGNLRLEGSSFTNKNGELNLVSISADVDRFVNDAGKLQVQKTIDFNVEELENINKGTIVAGNQISIDAKNIVNENNSILASDSSITLLTDTLKNHNSEIFAKGLEIKAKDVDNKSGTLTSLEELSIDANNLDNRQGKIQANQDIVLSIQDELDNSAGIIATGENLQLTATTLDNQKGILNVGDAVIQVAHIYNQEGEIGAHEKLVITANSLDNNQGKVLAESVDLTIDNIDNRQKGALLASKDLQVTGVQLYNETGVISADDVNLTIENINNQHGEISAEKELILTGKNLDNRDGLIASNKNLTIHNESTQNQSGKILAGGDNTLNIQDLNNQQGLIEGHNLLITGDHLDNIEGKIHGNDQVVLTLDKTLHNQKGEITSAKDLTITSTSHKTNATSELAINIEDGEILAGNDLVINVQELSGKGTLAAGQDLTIDLVADLSTSSTIQAGRDLLIDTDGNFVNSGEITSLGSATIHAGDIKNTEEGSIEANQKVVLTSQNNLENRGLINSNGLTHLDVQGAIYNVATGKIYGDLIAINAKKLHNTYEEIDGKKVSGSIAAREQLNIGVDYLLNEEGALLFSGNKLVIGGELDDNLNVVGNAGLVENKSATIESLGDMYLGADKLVNSNEHFRFEKVEVGEKTGLVYIKPFGESERYDVGHFRWEGWEEAGRYRWATSKPVTEAGIPGKTVLVEVGGLYCVDMADPETCSPIEGSDYLADNPAWAYFKITPPSLKPTFEDFGLPEELAILPPIKPEAPEQECDENPIACDFYKKDLEIYEKDLALYNEILLEHEELIETYQEEYDLFVTSMVTWYEQSEDLYAQLDDAIYEYNQKIAGKNWGEVRDFTQYNLKETYFEDQIVESDGGKIIAGGNLTLNGGEFINDKSTIIVGGSILGDIESLKNIDQKGEFVIEESGSVFLSTTYKKKVRFRNRHRRNHRYAGEYFDEKIEEIDLKAYTVETNTLVQSENAGSVGNVSNIVVTNAGNSGFTDHDLADTNNQNEQYHNDQNLVIANVDVNTDLPSSSIYSIDPNSQDYLIETDSKFTNYKDWLGSDYMLTHMGLDPQNTLKRLGDGYYEQRLINDQIAQLTGRRFLEGYKNDEDQFKALMENGATFATGLGIAPGVKLSADQVARLTSDIVWLETETVTLADGSRVDVLVPKVYLMIDQNSINQSGTLIAGDSINLNMSGDLVNQGTIAGRDITSLKANNIENIGGTISGNRVGLTAKENITIAGGSVLADSQLALNAGKDVTIESTTYETNSSNNSRTGIKREASLYVKNPDGTLSVQAGNDITLKAANIENAGENGKTQLLAGGNINIGTITESESATFVADAKNYDHTARTKDIGSTITAKGDLLIKADDQVNVIGSDLHSDSGTVAISGDKGVNISEGRETLDSSGSRYAKSSGSFSSQSREINFTDKNDTSISSNVTGRNVVIVTKDDLNIQGSNVVADENVTLVADKNINITASEDHYYHDEEEILKKSGLMGSGGGFGFSVGKKEQETYDENSALVHNGSMVGSLGGNVNIKAGENYTQEGSYVSAVIGDVNITAESVDIKAAEDSYSSYHHEKFKQSGLTVSVGGSAIDLVNQVESLQESIKDVGKSKNDRVNAMAAANAAMDAYRLGKSAETAKDLLTGAGKDPEIAKVTVSIGSSKSESETWTEDKVASGSSIQAGGNVNITATGAGEDSNITIEGSYVGGGQSTNLTADNDINIIAAESTSSEASKNSSSGWNAGVVAAIGSDGTTGFGITAGANKGKGKGQGSGEYYTNSVVGTETGKTTIKSGGNTNIIGGEVYGKGIELNVAGDLTIASTQDRSDYHSDQKDSSIQGTWLLGGGGSVSGSHSQSKIDANHQSVTDQSGIFAGDDGFQVKVDGNTHLSGGVVVANEKAELEGLNSFETGTITANDLVNKSEYDGEGFGISGGYGYQNDGPNNPKGTNPTQTETVNLPDGSHSVNKNVGYGKDKESESSITQSGIGTGNIKVTDNEKQKELTGQTAEEAAKGIETDLTTETADANSGALENIFDKEKVQAEIDLQVKVTQQFDRTRQDMKQIINTKIDEYKDSDSEKAKDWQNAGLLLDMLAGGLSSPGEGFLGSLAGAANPLIAQTIKGLTDGTLDKGGLGHILAHGIAGAAMAAANGGDLLSGALTAGGTEALAPIIAEFLYGKGKTPEDLTADEKNTLSAIIGILGTGAGALTGDSAIDAVIGDSVATNAVENNFSLIFNNNLSEADKEYERFLMAKAMFGDDEKAYAYLEGRREGELAGLKESGADLIDSLLHPIDTLVDSAVGIWEVVTDPKGTYDQVVISYNDWEELLAYAMENDPKAAGEMLGIVAGNVEFNAGLTMLTMGGVAAINSSGKLGQLLQKLAKDKQSSSSSSSSSSSGQNNNQTTNINSGSVNNQKYLDEMRENGIKFTPENIVRIEKLPDGKIVFLEKGNSNAGLQHIIERHEIEFMNMGIGKDKIGDVIMDTIKNGKVIGYQGKGKGRPIYETVINGKRQEIAITIGDNGYVVGANPRSK